MFYSFFSYDKKIFYTSKNNFNGKLSWQQREIFCLVHIDAIYFVPPPPSPCNWE